ncbi:MAG TPA: hypothetical protein VG713_01465 [Pirellulales bacterium]|nr:hypothetical protein [Pirellulales bacterium]
MWRWIFVGLMLVNCSVVRAGDTSSNLATLKAIGHEGAGNEAAQQAWKQLVADENVDLTSLLAALDDVNPLAANYIHAAIDTIAERQLKAGKLSAAELEVFIRSTGHAPRARRLAFDWLARLDPSAGDRMIPGFLDDPSLELRREAVARLYEQGKKADDVARVRKAFDAARDLDQIEAIAKTLKEQDQAVDLPKHFGFVMSWKVIGPFENRKGVGYAAVYPPEKELSFAASYPGKEDKPVQWIDYTTEDEHGMVDLNKALGKDMGCVGYAAAEFDSPVERQVELRVGCICACKWWLNGALIGDHEVYHSGNKIDQYVSRGTLRPGRNTILVKVCQNEQTESWAQDWEFQLRVCDAVGTAVLSQK